MRSRQLLRAHSLCSSPPAACWALPVFTEQPTINIFSPLFQISARFLGQLSVFLGQLHQCRIFVYPLPCQPISSLLTSIRQRPITGLSSSSPSVTFSSPNVWVSSPQIYERVNIVESFPDPHRSLRFRNGTFDLREIPAKGKILNKFDVDSD